MRSAVADVRGRLVGEERTIVRVLAALALLVAVGIPLVGTTFQLGLGNRILIYSLWAMSLGLLLRNMRLLTLGHAAFLGAGAYGVALGQHHWGLDFWSAAVVGLLFGMGLSVVFGLMIMRATDIFFVMITVAQGMIFWGIIEKWTTVTGGDQGLRNVEGPEQFSTPRAYYYFTLVTVLVCIFVLYRFDRSIIGLRLRGIGDSEERMGVLGYGTRFYRFVAFNVAGFFASIAGILFAGYFHFVAPGTVHLSASVEVALMAIIGGAQSFVGPIVGAATLLTLNPYVAAVTDRWPIVLGVLLIVVVLYARTGIVGGVRRLVYGSSHSGPRRLGRQVRERSRAGGDRT